MKNKGKKTFLRYAFLLILMMITVYLVLKSLDISMLSNVIHMVDKEYLLVGVIAILFYIILEGIILQIITNEQHKVNSNFVGFKLAIMGFYYNLVTPFASGSQPVQIYVLSKHKVPLSKATGIITNKTILYQVVTTIFCTIFIFINSNKLLYDTKTIMPLAMLGLGVNLSSFILGFIAIIKKDKIKKLSNKTISYLLKFKLFKMFKLKDNMVDTFIDEYTESIKFFMRSKKLLIITVMLTIIQITCYFSVAYWIYKAFNLSGYSFIYLMTLQVYLYMAISPIPTPGNIGANELAFFTIFKRVFPQTLLGYAVFLYCGYMYYFILIGTGIFTIYYHHKMDKKEVEKEKDKVKIIKEATCHLKN